MAVITGEQAYAQRLQVTYQALYTNLQEGDRGGSRSSSRREVRGEALRVIITGPLILLKSPEIREKE